MDGAADEDKTATIEIELNTLQNVFAGAQSASLRLYSPIGTYEDVSLTATDSTLQISVTPSTYAEDGQVYPVYDAHVTFQVDDAVMGTGQSVVAWFANSAAYSKNTWGSVDPRTKQASVDFLMTDFDAAGMWGVPSILMIDAAGNRAWANFSNAPGNEPETFVRIDSKSPDTTPPEVSLEDDPANGLHAIQISAHPTHPDAPDGETAVTIDYQARDDLSGLGMVSYRLLDPQGISHQQYDYHPNFYTKFFQGDPTAWAEYQINVILPVGSAPGTWGLQELYAPDKVGNVRDLDFVETMHFEVQ